MTVFGYVRVSTLAQANEGESLETQKRQVISYAESRGLSLQVENVFIERGVSGGDEFYLRPEGSRLMSVLTAGDVLIFPKLDRGFRNTRDALNTLHDLKERSVSVHSIDLGGDVTGNGVGAIIFTILSAFATFEKERIATRIKEVKQRRKAEGYFIGGRRGFGYNVVDGKLAYNEEEQRLIKEMRRMVASGKSLTEVHNWLNKDQGVSLAYSSMRVALMKDFK